MTTYEKSDALLARLHELHPLLIDLSLDRIRTLMAKLGHPERRLPPVMHVAGTNGKGSTIAFMQAILQAAGKRVHAYTSPHLVRFHERIQLAGDDGQTTPIAEAALVDVLERVAVANDGAPMTFFEITTAAAFLAFVETPADVVLLEVGLGGRLDATNLVDEPALTIITPVSIDHADKLGDTLDQIALEKAGILKPHVAAVIGPQPPEALAAIQQVADRVKAPLLSYGQHFDAFEERGRLVFQSEHRLLDLPLPALLGRNQVVNAGVAIAALSKLDFEDVSTAAYDQGLQEAKWPARFSRLSGCPFRDWVEDETELWLDGGHNPAAGQALAQTLADLEERAPKPTFLICAMMAQKDAEGFLHPFQGIAKGAVVVPIPDEANAMPPAELARHARNVGLSVDEATDVRTAIKCIEKSATGAKRILICGSLYLAGRVLAHADG